MRVEPDTDDLAAAAAEGRALGRLVGSVLGLAEPNPYPGLVALAHDWRTIPARERVARLPEELERAERAAHRAGDSGPRGWDLAPAEPHLAFALRRALEQLPSPGAAELADWSDADRVVARRAAELVAGLWPEMADEMTSVVRQLALLAGPAINGFTDFATHGVVYVNRTRCAEGAGGLPAHWHLAEALVHEATHNRCNAATLRTPFLVGDRPALVDTPLRSDPRPLVGLFQQVVVLARCARLYERGTRLGDAPLTALVERHATLCNQGLNGVRLAHRHAARFTAAGAAVLREAESILATERPVGAGRAS